MDGLSLLGADAAVNRPQRQRVTLAVAAAAVSALLFRKSHPVLAAIGGAALASNVHAVATGERSWKVAAKRLGRHAAAAAGSLAMPKYPAIGWLGAAAAANMLIAGEGDGVLDEWVGSAKHYWRGGEVIDAEIVEQRGLVKR